MVSTRGAKFKFCDGEKVLCYEPDPSKAKVLYDSKVLEVVQKGRKSIEYLIHFQGWNSSWDRCVPEEFVLKDTEENRELQRELAEKAQLQLKERARPRRSGKWGRGTTSDSESEMDEVEMSLEMLADLDHLVEVDVLEDDELVEVDDEGNKENEHDIFVETHQVPLDIPAEVKRFLDHDWYRLNHKNMRIRLPAAPNILIILETYVKHNVRELLREEFKAESDRDSKLSTAGLRARRVCKRRGGSSHSSAEDEEDEYQTVRKNLSLCLQCMESVVTWCDFLLERNLLYRQEKSQFRLAIEICKLYGMDSVKYKFNPATDMQHRLFSGKMESDSDDQGKSDTEAELLEMISAVDEGFAQRWSELLKEAGCEMDEPLTQRDPELRVVEARGEESGNSSSSEDQAGDFIPAHLRRSKRTGELVERKRLKRAKRVAPEAQQAPPVVVAAPSGHGAEREPDWRKKELLACADNWKAKPDDFVTRNDPMATQLYGAPHLARLLVTLPRYLPLLKLPPGHERTIQKQSNRLLRYLASQPQWFAESNYVTEIWDSDNFEKLDALSLANLHSPSAAATY